jgi:hypothetical protein
MAQTQTQTRIALVEQMLAEFHRRSQKPSTNKQSECPTTLGAGGCVQLGFLCGCTVRLPWCLRRYIRITIKEGADEFSMNFAPKLLGCSA